MGYRAHSHPFLYRSPVGLTVSWKNGICDKKIPFAKGTYALTLSVTDLAGNSIGLPVNLVVDY